MNSSKSLNDTLQHMQNGDVHLAEINLKEILSKYPDNPDALSLLGIILIHQKNFKKGKDLIKLSLLINPSQPQAILNLGLAFYQENKFDEAIKFFDQAIQHQSNYLEAYYCKALSFQKKDMFEEAIECFTDACNINPEHFDSIFNLGHLYFDLKKFQEAVKIFEKALDIDPENIEVLNMLAHSLNQIHDYDRAVIIFNKSLKIISPQEDAMVGLGYAYQQKSDFYKSLEIYSYVLSLNSEHILALNNRANIFYSLEHYPEAIKDLDLLIAIQPEFPNAYTTYGNILTKLEKFDEALKKFELALKIDKNYSEAFQNRGMMFFAQKKYDNAISDFNAAIKNKPDYFDAYNSRGVCFKAIKNFDSALYDFKKAIELNNRDAEIFSNLAELYYAMGISDESFAMHKKALTLDSQNPIVNYNFSIHLLTLKYFNEAWVHYEYRVYINSFKKTFASHSSELKKLFKYYQGPFQKGTLVILDEQGIGDSIIYSSLLHDVQKVHNKIIVFVHKKLINLFKRSFKGINFISTASIVAKEEYIKQLHNQSFDYFTFYGSLGNFFRRSLEDFKTQPIKFLKSDPIEMNSLFALLHKEDKKLCGLSWKSKSEFFGADKSIHLKDLINIIKIRELIFVNLQYGEVEEEIKFINSEFGVNIDLVGKIDKYNNVDGLASLIDACDFIVTTSNVTAHIAGALGKDTYLLVPFATGKIWYWHEHDDKSIWYPSVKIFRQNKDGSWNDAITSIAQELKGVVGE